MVMNDDGQLTVFRDQGVNQDGQLSVGQLSSGEKQIVILLSAALLRQNTPVVYIADEPELSLHVKWQSKLLQSLLSIGGTMQVVVATHSPDIAGKFRDRIVELRHG